MGPETTRRKSKAGPKCGCGGGVRLFCDFGRAAGARKKMVCPCQGRPLLPADVLKASNDLAKAPIDAWPAPPKKKKKPNAQERGGAPILGLGAPARSSPRMTPQSRPIGPRPPAAHAFGGNPGAGAQAAFRPRHTPPTESPFATPPGAGKAPPTTAFCPLIFASRAAAMRTRPLDSIGFGPGRTKGQRTPHIEGRGWGYALKCEPSWRCWDPNAPRSSGP